MNTVQKLKLQHSLKMIAVCIATLYLMIGVTRLEVSNDELSKGEEVSTTQIETQVVTEKTESTESVTKETIIAEVEEVTTQISKSELEYPFNTETLDFEENQLDGFVEYEIPSNFSDYGGYFPIELQQFTYSICKEYNVDYSLILAIIEIESSYKYNAVSSCNAIGYMQILEVYHIDRMGKLQRYDLFNPYTNVMVGIDFMAQLINEYSSEGKALMFYNLGYNACDLWEEGIYESEYSRKVLTRKAEIEMELAKGENSR